MISCQTKPRRFAEILKSPPKAKYRITGSIARNSKALFNDEALVLRFIPDQARS